MKVHVSIYPTDGTMIWNPDMATLAVRSVFLVMPCGAQFVTGHWTGFDGEGKGSWAPQNRLQATFTAIPRFPFGHVRADCVPHFQEQDCSFVQTIGRYQVAVRCTSKTWKHFDDGQDMWI